MKFIEGKIYTAFDIDHDSFDYEIVQCKCTDAENFYFETLDSKKGWTDSQYDDFNAAKKYVFLNLKYCQRGVFKFIFTEDIR